MSDAAGFYVLAFLSMGGPCVVALVGIWLEMRGGADS